MIDPLKDIIAVDDSVCPPIYREVGSDLGFFPDVKPLTIERVARIFDVPEELVATQSYADPEEEIRARCAPEVADGVVRLAHKLGITKPVAELIDTRNHYGRWLHAEEIPPRARRPWVSVEQLDATQQIPVIRDETP